MDGRLRQLERAAGESVNAEAAYLLARVQAGTLTRDRLELAAYCLHEAAEAALAACAGVERTTPLYMFVGTNEAMLAAFVRGLGRWSPAMQVRAVAELTQWLVDERPFPTAEEQDVAATVMLAVWHWLADPTRMGTARVFGLDDVALGTALGTRVSTVGPLNQLGALAYAICAYEHAAFRQTEKWAMHCVDMIVRPFRVAVGVDPGHAGSAVPINLSRTTGTVGPRQAMDVMRNRLAKWALERPV